MKELRILLSSICLVYLAVLSPSLSASSGEVEHSRSQIEHHESDDDDSIEHQNEKKQEIAKKNKERLKKIAELRKKNKKIVRIVVPKAPVTPTKPVTPVVPKTPTTPTAPTAPVVTAVTKSSTVSYRTPAGSDAITFTATVKGGIITAVSSVTKAQNSTSIWYQDTFAAKISQAVVGKKIAGLNLSAVGGASLTTTAFEQFIASSF